MSAIKTPFDKDNFAEEMKPKISGVHLTLDYVNIESSMAKVAMDCSDVLSEKLYDNICDEKASENEDLQAKALDYLQRAMLHFCMYEHLIFLITQIKNDGVTVLKSEKESTVYKYLQDELDLKLVTTAWVWMNRLIKLLDENKEDFPDWKGSKNDLSDIPIDMKDFDKWVGVKDEYFLIVSRWLIREVWIDCVLSRQKEPKKTDEMVRALCYDVMGRACIRLAYFTLPEPIRKDVNNEMGKNHAAQSDKTIRDKIAEIYRQKASSYWTTWDISLKQKDVTAGTRPITDRPVYKRPKYNANDKFGYSS